MTANLRIVNLERGFPDRGEACRRLELAIARARKDGVSALKLIHGYGSTGVGGTLRFVVRGWLRQHKDYDGELVFIAGESLSSFDGRSKALVQRVPEVLLDPDWGKGNKGVTFVLL